MDRYDIEEDSYLLEEEAELYNSGPVPPSWRLIDDYTDDEIALVENHRPAWVLLQETLLNYFSSETTERVSLRFEDLSIYPRFMDLMKEPGDTEDDTNIRATAMVLAGVYYLQLFPHLEHLHYYPTYGVPVVLKSSFLLNPEIEFSGPFTETPEEKAISDQYNVRDADLDHFELQDVETDSSDLESNNVPELLDPYVLKGGFDDTDL